MIRILLADDHAMVRAGLKQILTATGDIDVVGEATNGHEVLTAVRELDFDVLVLDMSMPGRSGIELIRLVKAERPRLIVLVLSMHSEEQYAVRAVKAGAAGYLTKDSAADQLVAAVRRVAGGGAVISPETARQLVQQMNTAQPAEAHTLLSDREYQVFRMLAAGRSVTEIGDDLALSVKTISTHKTRIMHKLGVTNASDLVRYALSHRLLDEPGAMPG